MQPSFPRSSRPSFLVVALGLLAAGCLLGACDRHSAADLPESYGHGSSHQKSFDRHEPDSRDGTKHFSDSQGIAPASEREGTSVASTPKPGESTPAPLFPGSN